MTLDHIEEIINPEEALRVYDTLFTERTGNDIFFTSRIPKRGMVHPPPPLGFDGLWKQNYREAFVTAVKATGEDAFYFSRTMRFEAVLKPKPGFEDMFGNIASISTTSIPSHIPPYAVEITPVVNDWIFPLSIDWKIDSPEMTCTDYAVYSLNGTWGLWFSLDGFMIIGGSEEFVDTFFQLIGSTIEEMVFNSVAGVMYEEYAWDYLSKLFSEEQVLIYKAMYKSREE
jgi:hypothetical protein